MRTLFIQRINCTGKDNNNEDEATSGDTNNYNSPPKSQKSSSTKSAGKINNIGSNGKSYK